MVIIIILTGTKSMAATRSKRSRSPTPDHLPRRTAIMSRRLLAILSLTIFPLLSTRAASVDEKPMMKAVVAHEYGAPEVLKFEQVPRPEPKDDEALVHVIA